MHNHHNFWLHLLPRKELTQVYASAALRSFAISLVSLFIPLYLYIERGYSLQETLLFFLIYSVLFALFTPLAAKFSARYGVKHAVLISVPLYLVFIVLLYLLPQVNIPLSVIGFFLGMSLAFYWMGMNLVFRKASKQCSRGAEVGKNMSISILATMIGPLLGGLIIQNFGFKILFIISGLGLLGSAFFLFLSKEKHIPYNFSLKNIFANGNWSNALFFMSRGTYIMAEGVIWPLFIFAVLGSYASLGLMGMILSGISALLLWKVGCYSDKIDRRKIIISMSIFESLGWFMRSVVDKVWHVFGITIFGAIVYGIREAPMEALELDKAQRDIATYFVHREIFICLGRILMILIVLIAGNLGAGLWFQGIATLAALLF
ncbi:MFS transporter [Candidatus Woesearchaeota archaeon]|nr:MFS transporter [Candidatus Woesearchaeota archaeon]